MAHFVKMNGVECGDVIVISNDDLDNLPFPASEPIGQAFIKSLGIDGEWLQTSYSGSFRNLYAGPNMIFDSSIGKYGAFILPIPDEA